MLGRQIEFNVSLANVSLINKILYKFIDRSATKTIVKYGNFQESGSFPCAFSIAVFFLSSSTRELRIRGS